MQEEDNHAVTHALSVVRRIRMPGSTYEPSGRLRDLR